MLWVVVRLALIAVGVGAGAALLNRDNSTLGPMAAGGLFLVLTLVGASVVLLMMASIRLGHRHGKAWSRPSWRLRPFFGEPLQFLHALAFYFIAAGLSAALQALGRPGRPFVAAAMVAGVGSGQLLGVYLTVRFFPRDSQPATERRGDDT